MSYDGSNSGGVDLVKIFRRRLESARQHQSRWEREAREAQRFYAGHQWPQETLDRLRDLDRPAVTFNRVAPMADAVVGLMASTGLEARFLPRTQARLAVPAGNPGVAGDDDTVQAEIANELWRWTRQLADVPDHENLARRDLVVTGRGVTVTRLDFDRDPDGQIVVERVDPLTVWPDPASAARGFADGAWVIAGVELGEEELKERFGGDAPDRVRRSVEDRSRAPEPAVSGDYRLDAREVTGPAEGRYELHEYQYWTREPFWRWASPGAPAGELEEATEAEFGALKTRLAAALAAARRAAGPRPPPPRRQAEELAGRLEAEQAAVPLPPDGLTAEQLGEALRMRDLAVHARTGAIERQLAEARALAAGLEAELEAAAVAVCQMRRVYWRAFVSGCELLAGPERLPVQEFTYVFRTGVWDDEKGVHYGIIRAMMDPQRWLNKSVSTLIDLLETAPKGGIIVEEGAVDDPVELEESYARHDAVTTVKPGKLGAIRPKPSPQPVPQLADLMSRAERAFADVTGINPAILGRTGANTPGVTNMMYLQAGAAMLWPYFAAESGYIRRQGRVFLSLARALPGRQIARVAGSGAIEWIEFAPGRLAPRYDIIVSESERTQSRQMDVWAVMREMLPWFEKMGWMDLVFQVSLLPAELKGEVMRRLAGAQQQQADGGESPEAGPVPSGETVLHQPLSGPPGAGATGRGGQPPAGAGLPGAIEPVAARLG